MPSLATDLDIDATLNLYQRKKKESSLQFHFLNCYYTRNVSS